MSTFVNEPFVNELNQKIMPGDKVVGVVQGYNHSVRIITGTFDGVYKDHNSNVVGTRVIHIPVVRKERVYDDKGDFAEQNYDYDLRAMIPNGRRYNLIPKITYRKSTLQRNRIFKLDTQLKDVDL